MTIRTRDYDVRLTDLQARLRPHLAALAPGLLAIALMLVWAVHDGGYDADTWYWGALLLLGVLAAIVFMAPASRLKLSRLQTAALAGFALYVAWSYLSISWAQSPGDALAGSNRALLYLLVFTLLLLLPWTPRSALAALLTFAGGVGVIAIVLLFRLADADHVARLVIGGRLAAPTGYFNSTAALFTMGALTSIALAAGRRLPGLVRGLLLAFACAGLQLAVIVQSRGWLFTLPLIALVSIIIMRDRLSVALAAALPVAGALVPLHRLLDVYTSSPSGQALNAAAARAGQAALVACAVVFVAGTLAAWGAGLVKPRRPNPRRRRTLGAVVAGVAVAGLCVGALAATHGDPVGFVTRQWRGFSHTQTASSSTSHFADVGSGRYDFWRVSLDAFLAHPVGGLGQDNFADYYVVHRRTTEEPEWTHSLEMRLLAQTGLVGFALFAVFLCAAIAAAIQARRRSGDSPEADLRRFAAGAALLPLVVWLVHGSVDWFWEIPALSGPALGFLAIAGALGRPERRLDGSEQVETPRRGAIPRALPLAGGVVALVAAVVVLGFPYLSVREVSVASDIRATDPNRALTDLSTAADLNPLNADPGRIGGTIALQNGFPGDALRRFDQAIAREPRGWYGWLGAGLAASSLGERALARHDFEVAASINARQPAVTQALARVDTAHPLTPSEALQMLVVVS